MFTVTDNLQENEVLTVHQLNQTARTLLENAFQLVWVSGELSNVATPRSGHIYFTLKDAHAQVRCAMFKANNRRLDFIPKDGMAVKVRASVSIYEERGDYQLIVLHMDQWGAGLLQQAFEALKAKLQAEGLFDTSLKKPLPRFPRHIGVITSPTGAAIQDILSVLKRRFPVADITIYPTQVQGKAAAKDIVSAIKSANRKKCADVLILARGGGSLEDLWCFNEEIVARAIRESAIPIVTGIGHEVDFTIADFAADLRAPTPSAAAETVTPDKAELLKLFEQKRLRLIHAMRRELQHYALKLDNVEKQLIHPGRYVEQAMDRCKYLTERLKLVFENLRQQFENKFTNLSTKLHAVSPLATLGRGYAIVTDPTDGIVRDSSQLEPGQLVETRLNKGSFVSTVKEVL